MYLDFLGFTELIKDESRAMDLFRIIDDLNAHKDANYKVIAFSDTLLIYNSLNPSDEWYKKVELMYLIEFAQDLLAQLIEKDIYFKAVITEGEFCHNRLKNIDAYFGPALVDTHKVEKDLKGTGLYLDSKLRGFNAFFNYVDCGEGYDYVLLTQQLAGLRMYMDELPLDKKIIIDQVLGFGVYQECQFLKKVYNLMLNHPVEKVRVKYKFTWDMYSKFHSMIMNALIDSEFNMNALAVMDWSSVKKDYDNWYSGNG